MGTTVVLPRRELHGERRLPRMAPPLEEKARVRSVPCMVKMFMVAPEWWCCLGVGESS